jgi:hypothetical protein
MVSRSRGSASGSMADGGDRTSETTGAALSMPVTSAYVVTPAKSADRVGEVVRG